MKLPVGKRWEFLRDHSIKLKTIGEEEREEKNTFEYYINMMSKNQQMDLDTLLRFKTKMHDSDSLALRNFAKLEGFMWIIETLNYYIEYKVSYVFYYFIFKN